MDGADDLLGGLASGDPIPPMIPEPSRIPLKRDHDSMDDFEHLEREGKHDAAELPGHHAAARAATQGFLDMERAPSANDNLADKFTDSESDADATGESPLHRPAPPVPVPASVAGAAVPPLPKVPATTTAPETALASEPIVSSMTAPEVPKKEPPMQPVTEVMKPTVPTTPILPEPVVTPPPVKVEPPKPQPPKPEPHPASNTKPEPPKTVAHVIEAEVIFRQMGLDAWFDPKRLHPQVESLMYWRSPARSGAVLGGGLALLVALACCSVVAVVAHAALLALAVALAYRLYKNVLQAVHKTNDGHPFKAMLEADISVGAERAQELAAAATAHLNAATAELRRLFLVEDLVDSLKFGVLLWCLTYIGSWFNGITLIILAWLAVFTLPKAYEMNKAQVDANLELARNKINEISAKVRAAVPLGRKAESEKDK